MALVDWLNTASGNIEQIATAASKIIATTQNGLSQIKDSASSVANKPLSEQQVTIGSGSGSVPTWVFIALGVVLLFGKQLKRMF